MTPRARSWDRRGARVTATLLAIGLLLTMVSAAHAGGPAVVGIADPSTTTETIATSTTEPPSTTTTTSPPAEPPLAELQWMIDGSGRLPIPEDEVRQHVAPGLLDQLGGPDGFNGLLGQVGAFTLHQQLWLTSIVIHGIIFNPGSGFWLVKIELDGNGQVTALTIQPYPPTPGSWEELDARLRALAPQVSFGSSIVDADGECHQVFGVEADTARPLASSFKIYVLGTLARAVAEGRAGWDQPLAIREPWKSLPGGELVELPEGTELLLREYANKMISISDNTATDHLIHFFGRGDVVTQLTEFGNEHTDANTPFISTKEVGALKNYQYPTLADQYLALPREEREQMLEQIDQIPRSELSWWQDPRRLNEIEWFASPNDICRAYAGLAEQNAQPGLEPVGEALSMNDGNIGLDRSRFPVVWHKAGSEPGLRTLTYLVRTVDGTTVVTSVMLANHDQPLDEPAAIYEALALARGGIELATAGR